MAYSRKWMNTNSSDTAMYLVGGCQQSSGRLRAILWLFFFGSRDSVVLQVVLVVRDLPQKQRSERRHLRLDL